MTSVTCRRGPILTAGMCHSDTGIPLCLHRYVNTHFTKMVKTKSGICSIVWTKQNGGIFNNKSLKQGKAAVSKVWASNMKHKEKHAPPFVIRPAWRPTSSESAHVLPSTPPAEGMCQSIGSSSQKGLEGEEEKSPLKNVPLKAL